jgi:3-hydroxybutyrate dehydrogenase
LEHIDTKSDFLLPPGEVVKAMLALITEPRYKSGTVLEVNDVGGWREVQLLNEPGPQGHSKLPRVKALEAIKLVKEALEVDAQGSKSISKL